MRVLIADDRPKVRDALRLLLAQEPELEMVGEAADATGVLLLLERTAADLVLLDWELPGLPAASLLNLLRFERPGVRVIAMSGRPEAREAALNVGADAFFSKGDPPEAVLGALQALRRPPEELQAT